MAVVGMAATGVAQVCKVAVQMMSAVVLARLLMPMDFGLVAMVTPIVAFVALFQDMGLQQAIVQNREISKQQISRMFWINTGMGVFVAAVLVTMAPVVGWFYGEPRVVWLTRAWALPLLSGCIAAQHLALLNRNLRFRRLALIDVVAAVATLTSGVLLASWLRSYWALLLSTTLGSVTTLVMARSATKWRPLAPLVGADVSRLMRFGMNLAGFNFVNYFSRNLDNILVAKLFGPSSLGLYDRAYKLLLWPLSNINAPVGRVMLPILARLRDEGERYRWAFIRVAALITWGCVPGVTALSISAWDVVPLLLGDRWAGAAGIFAWLGLAGVVQPLGNVVGWLFISQHRTREMLRWAMFAGMSTILSFIVGIPWGVPGIAAAYAVGSVIRLPILAWWVGRSGPVGTADLLRIQLPVALSGVLSLVVMVALKGYVALAPIGGVIVSLVVSYGAAVGVILFGRSTRAWLVMSLDVAAVRKRVPWLLPKT
jgi:O-antigen/teichoic acid export membrane protein